MTESQAAKHLEIKVISISEAGGAMLCGMHKAGSMQLVWTAASGTAHKDPAA